MECSWCGEDLVGAPKRDPVSGEIMCDGCYEEYFQFTCFWCENGAETSQQGLGHYLLVKDQEEAGLAPGVYQIVEMPYYVSDYVSMTWIESALKHMEIPVPEIGDSRWPCGFV